MKERRKKESGFECICHLQRHGALARQDPRGHLRLKPFTHPPSLGVNSLSVLLPTAPFHTRLYQHQQEKGVDGAKKKKERLKLRDVFHKWMRVSSIRASRKRESDIRAKRKRRKKDGGGRLSPPHGLRGGGGSFPLH